MDLEGLKAVRDIAKFSIIRFEDETLRVSSNHELIYNMKGRLRLSYLARNDNVAVITD